MTAEHKAALSRGRAEGRIVKDYLEALRSNRPRRGRRRTPASIDRRLTAVQNELREANPLNELKLMQERRNLLSERASRTKAVDISEFEERFASIAKEYSARHGISYLTWREFGVPANVLRRAGMSRTS